MPPRATARCLRRVARLLPFVIVGTPAALSCDANVWAAGVAAYTRFTTADLTVGGSRVLLEVAA
jgi:hypothetical protein